MDTTIRPHSLSECTCLSCDKVFKTIGGRNSHQKQAQKCAWYNKQPFVFSDDSDCEDEILAQHKEASNNNLSEEQAVQPVDEDIILLSRPESHDIQPPTKKQKIDDSTLLHIHHPTAGKIF